jgi:hypothetical protein
MSSKSRVVSWNRQKCVPQSKSPRMLSPVFVEPSAIAARSRGPVIVHRRSVPQHVWLEAALVKEVA